MTAENPADTVIEQAAKVGAEAIYWTLEWEQLDDATRSDAIEFARALGDAGLLATPADQGEPTDLDRFIGAISDPLYLQGYLQGYQNGYKHAEAERDEAERDEAERDELEHRLACLLCELTGNRMSNTGYDVPTMVHEVEAYFERTVDDEVAELRATIDRVRELADKYRKFSGFNITARGAEKQLRAALDGGGQHE